jgi:hypothetical protein
MQEFKKGQKNNHPKKRQKLKNTQNGKSSSQRLIDFNNSNLV